MLKKFVLKNVVPRYSRLFRLLCHDQHNIDFEWLLKCLLDLLDPFGPNRRIHYCDDLIDLQDQKWCCAIAQAKNNHSQEFTLIPKNELKYKSSTQEFSGLMI